MKSTSDFVAGIWRQGTSIICALLLIAFPFGVPLSAQNPVPDQPPASQPPPQQLLTPEQLDNLVAPIALYPDPLLSQVLVAATYPLEIVEASQWLQRNRNLRGQQLVDAARQQNWDPSIQALVVFPDVVGRLSSNISWTTDLGNAFLAQQADVMSSVQRMRERARAAGKLGSDAEQRVNVETQGDRTVVEIVPANPQVIYVPQYNPEFIWGPPVWGYYPALYYPAIAFGFGFGAGIFLASFFGGWGGWGWGLGGWGWGPNWFGGSVLLNGVFFNHYGFRNAYGYGGGWSGRGGVWAHNPYHRLGVPYPTRSLGGRFGGSYAGRGGTYGGGARSFGSQRGAPAGGGWRSFGSGNTAGSRSGAVYGGSRAQSPRMQANTRAQSSGGGQWSHFNGYNASSSYRGGNSYRSGGGSYRSAAPSYNYNRGLSSPSRGTQSFRQPAPSYGGGRSFGGSRPSYGGGGSRSFSGGHGSGGFHSSGGGSHGGGGGFHGGGGGSHGGRR